MGVDAGTAGPAGSPEGERMPVGGEAVSRKALIVGWVLSGIVAMMLLSGGVNAFLGSAQVIQGTTHLGYTAGVLQVLGTLELVCTLLYLIPRTAVLGAILLTGYFGGAVASHLRIGESLWAVGVLFGVLAWVGVGLREPRLRWLLPLRR